MSDDATRGLDFARCFEALTGHAPLRWQGRLFEALASGQIPSAVDLPTGLGKTSVIPIWLIALASGRDLPRRLVYIVNRRTVVDQATDVVEALRARLLSPDDARWSAHSPTLCDLANRLRQLGGCAAGEPPLAVSTLRGELADNREWKENPARPAIIVGTIDMIGSKLLFSGYGDGRYGRSHHAGLIGQDALIVHDEAHLSPAFDALLDAVTREQERTGEARRVRVMRLSATARGATGGVGTARFAIDDEDRSDPVVKQRLSARKLLAINEVEKDQVVATITAKALELGRDGTRVLVYVRSPDAAQKVRDELFKGLNRRAKGAEAALAEGEAARRVGLLTGTIRGHERDEIAGSDLFKAFQSKSDRGAVGDALRGEALFLVSTSAGEVGADWDADHLVCDLTTLDSMIQRFGRVNRLGGEGREAQIGLVVAPIGDKDPLKAPMEKTVEALKRLPKEGDWHDASPKVVSTLLACDGFDAAFSPMPKILSATDILFDHWSLTSIADEMPGRPAIEPYLHGVAEWEPPETHIAWRADIALLARAGGAGDVGQPVPCSRDDLEKVFDAFPLRSAETLRDRTDRVQEQLQKLADRLRKVGTSTERSQADGDEAESESESETEPDSQDENRPVPLARLPADPWVVLIRGGSAEWVQLADIAPTDNDEAKRAQRRLAFATVVLPVEAGGLKSGMLKGGEPAPEYPRSLDVAEVSRDAAGARQRVMVTGRPLLGGEALAGIAHATVALAPEGDDDAEPPVIAYRVAKGREGEPGERISLKQHTEAVSEAAGRIGASLGLDGPLVEALRLAGKWHDAGKARAVWQRYANNANGAGPIAKSDRYEHWKSLAGYRHEFGSILDAAASPEIQSLDAGTRDLVLHLIGVHHGWGRPHFEPRHFDRGDPSKPRPTAENEAVAVDVMQRFGRLQQRYGRWGLAWLESMLRCADAEASAAAAGGGDLHTVTAGGTR